MKRLLITTTALSVVLSSIAPLPLIAQVRVTAKGQEVMCLPDAATACPEGETCLVMPEAPCTKKAVRAARDAAKDAAKTEQGTDTALKDAETAAAKAAAKAERQAEKEAAAIAEDLAAKEAAKAEDKAAKAAEKAAKDADKLAKDAEKAVKDAEKAEQKAAKDAQAKDAAEAEAAAAAKAEQKAAKEAEQKAEDNTAKAAAKAAAAEAAAAEAAAEEDAARKAARAERQAAKEAADKLAVEAAKADAEAANAEAAKAAAAIAAQESALSAEEKAAKAARRAERQAAKAAAEEAAAAALAAEEAAAKAGAEAEAAGSDADKAAAKSARLAAKAARDAAREAALEAAADIPVVVAAEGEETPSAAAVDALTQSLNAENNDRLSAVERAEKAAADAASGKDTPRKPKAANTDDKPTKAPKITKINKGDNRTSAQDFATAAATTEAERLASEEASADDRKRSGLSNLEKFGLVVAGALVVGAVLQNGNRVVSNTGDRVVMQREDGQYVVLKDDDTLLRQPGSTVTTDTFEDGSTRTSVLREDGSRIVTIRDATGRVLRRARINADGSQTLLIDDLAEVEPINVATLPKAPVQGLIISASGKDAALRDALLAAQTGAVANRFNLRQIRDVAEVRALAPMVNVESVSFASGSAAIGTTEANKLVELGRLMRELILANPSEMFLIEGHTDAVGAAPYNLALSDRRAESLALALTEYFGVPPENMVVQGYGEQELKIPTLTNEPQNRRAVVRIISPLMQKLAQN